MRALLFSAFTLCTVLSSAQITIGEADFPSSNQSYFVSTANPANGLDFTQSGPDMSWDFSSLQPVNQVEQSFVSVSSVPFAYQFLFNNPFQQSHLADFAQAQQGFELGEQFSLTDFYAFFQKNPGDYRIVGYAGSVNGVPVPAQTNPIDVVYEFPLEYGQTASNYSEWYVEIPTLFSYKLEQTRNYEVEGWGTVTTPAGSYEALKVRMEIEAVDSIFVMALNFGFENTRNSIEYIWLAEGEGIPVLRAVETMGFVTTIEYKDAQIPDNVTEFTPDALKIYPNPATDQCLISVENPGILSLFDATGQLILTERISSPGYLLNTSALSPGVYLIQMEDGRTVRMVKE